MELVSGGLLKSLLEASLLLVALHPGKDEQGQPYVLLIKAVISYICWKHLDIPCAAAAQIHCSQDIV